MILDLGLIDYEECYIVQKELVRKRRSGLIKDSVILAEHNEVFTIGRTGDMTNILAGHDELLSCGIKVLRVDRGGDITYHGPGQLVAYPIIDLKSAGIDLHAYLRALEDAAIRLLGDFAVCGESIAGKTGAWVAGKKIASVGIGASNWVTFHGLSINVSCDLKFFGMINPCGMKDVEMTSLERLTGRKILVSEVKSRLLNHFKDTLGLSDEEHSYREAVLA